MGKSGRWLLGLIGVKKTSKSSQNDSSSPSESGKHDSKKTQREKRRWSFGRPSQNHSLDDMSKSHCPEKGLEQEHTEHTLAIAAASAADAAVAVAHSAAAVAHLTASHHKTAENGEWAAIRIQTAFRGYLARRALRALKGLVRLQALFRGHRVRKQAALTLRCMQALVRVQARVRARRVRMSEEGKAVQEQLLSRRRQQPARSRKSMEGWNASTCTVENLKAKAEQRQLGAIKRERALAYAFSQQVRKSTPKEGSLFIDHEAETPHWGWSWLERWMAARPWESPLMEKVDFEDSPVGKSSAGSTKIVEMDFTKLRQRKNKSKSHELLSAELDMVSRPTIQPWPSTPAGDSQSAAPYSRAESPHKAAMATPDLSHPSPVSCNRSDLVKQKKGMQDGGFTSLNNEDMPDEDECGFATTISSPRLSTTGPKSGMNFVISGSAKGEQTGDNIQPDHACPSFMASTQSAKAKFRSQSTPKQRPEPSEKSIHDAKKRQSLPVSDRKLASTASLSQKTLLQYHLNSSKPFTGSVALDRSFMSLTDGQYTMSVNGDAHGRYKF